MFGSIYRQGIVLTIAAFIGFAPSQSVGALDTTDIIGVSGFSAYCGGGSLTVDLTAHYVTRDRVWWGGYTAWDYGMVALYDANGTRLGYGNFEATANGDGGAPYGDATSAWISFSGMNPPTPLTVKMYDITDQFGQPEDGTLVDSYTFDPGSLNLCVPVIDTDHDGVKDSVDNCPTVFNPFQEDDDLDGIGNACEGLVVVPPVVPAAPEVNADIDDDGVPSNQDNCINEYNPGQEDGWGSAMGDTCDTDWYNRSGVEIQGFRQKDNTFDLHGNCFFFEDGASSCPVLASLDPMTFTPGDTAQNMTTVDANGWSVWLYYLHSNNGVDVYQVNTYRTSEPQPDSLIDDKLEIHVSGGSWEWYHRGGDALYHGI